MGAPPTLDGCPAGAATSPQSRYRRFTQCRAGSTSGGAASPRPPAGAAIATGVTVTPVAASPLILAPIGSALDAAVAVRAGRAETNDYFIPASTNRLIVQFWSGGATSV